MEEKKRPYSLDSKWLKRLSIIFGTEIEDGKLLYIPEYLGKGYFYWKEVMPEFSVVLIDISKTVNFKINEYACEDELVILQYDLRDEIILFEVKDSSRKIDYKINLGFVLIDGSILSPYIEPKNGNEVFALRFIVSKNFLSTYTGGKFVAEKNRYIYFNNHIDSKSIRQISALKEKDKFDISFELYLKGAALKILANFLERYLDDYPKPYKISQIQIDEIDKTKEFLLTNLYNSFLGVPFLAAMAGMTESKYKTLFKKIYHASPKKFFDREKIYLASKLLSSGVFCTMSEILFELNYSKKSNFSYMYFSVFGKKPSDDFVKRPTELL
jgi:AraC-like DNA-binding protein